MAVRRVNFDVTTDGGVKAYSLSVIVGRHVDLTKGHGTEQLTVGKTYFLVWHFMAPPGGKVSIRCTYADGSPVVPPIDDAIPAAGFSYGAGIAPLPIVPGGGS